MQSKSSKFRLGVGIILINSNKQVFMGERIDNVGAWQMPQGGINKKEEPFKAAKRELYEETGIKSVKILLESKDWFSYYLPQNLRNKLWGGKYIGQKQKWFALSFTGKEDEINLNASSKPEFNEWRWVFPKSILNHIVDFKRELYQKVLDEFKLLLD